MSWEDSNEELNGNCIQRLQVARREREEQLSEINTILHESLLIQTRTRDGRDKDNKPIVITTLPKDAFGEFLSDSYKLDRLTKIASKTDELLGDEVIWLVGPWIHYLEKLVSIDREWYEDNTILVDKTGIVGTIIGINPGTVSKTTILVDKTGIVGVTSDIWL